jgi:hypothetical protein
MARDGLGLSKVSLGPAMPNQSTPCGWPPLKRPYSHFRGGRPAERSSCDGLPPFWTPHAIRLCRSRRRSATSWWLRTTWRRPASLRASRGEFHVQTGDEWKVCVSVGPSVRWLVGLLFPHIALMLRFFLFHDPQRLQDRFSASVVLENSENHF